MLRSTQERTHLNQPVNQDPCRLILWVSTAQTLKNLFKQRFFLDFEISNHHTLLI